jgi:hypothetical protein
VIARAVGVGLVAVSTNVGTGNNGEPQCGFAAGGAGRRRVVLVANVDTSPQPYGRLERAIVEAGQQFGTVRTFAPPQTVSHLGLDASWFPDLSELMTTDGRALITVTVKWPRAPQRRQRELAAAVARTYLGPLDAKLAKPPVPAG